MSNKKVVQRALLSVSDKTGLVELGRGLSSLGVQLLATGGTANALEEAGLKITRTDTLTGFTELLDGRVKTLHPAIHAGLLARRDLPQHMEQLRGAGFFPLDLLVVNLYPFEKTVSKDGVTVEEAIENIDIGGVALIRSAGKNHADVAVLTDPADYQPMLDELKANGNAVSLETRQTLALKAFRHTSNYDTAIAGFLGERFPAGKEGIFPDRLVLPFRKKSTLRYGENPHQTAAVYEEAPPRRGTLANAEAIFGKELSHNNYLDFDSALSLAHEFDEPACAVIKHRNPCGCSAGQSLSNAIEKAVMADPLSAFGGMVAINRVVDKAAACTIMEILKQVRKFDGLAAVDFTPEALELLKAKKDTILLKTGTMPQTARYSLRGIGGGLLVQAPDIHKLDPKDLKVATKRAPTATEMQDLMFAWKVVKHVVSNAIVFAKDGVTIGIGAGQVNRVGSVAIAAKMAGEKAKGAAMASDAFFPFPDGVEEAAKAGITAAIQPGGSMRDAEAIGAADKYGMSMVLTGIRHFKH
jgi:phosphoribosylaminoimidazolecarboxamide formyltransferase/IMP cyclohydrolase